MAIHFSVSNGVPAWLSFTSRHMTPRPNKRALTKLEHALAIVSGGFFRMAENLPTHRGMGLVGPCLEYVLTT